MYTLEFYLALVTNHQTITLCVIKKGADVVIVTLLHLKVNYGICWKEKRKALFQKNFKKSLPAQEKRC